MSAPEVFFIEDVARALRTSRRTIERLRRYRCFPIPEIASIDKRPRWSADAVRDFIRSGQAAGRLRRAG